ncbi:MAG TPA: protease SohB, partial [Spongiibacteraceae bacterium]
MQLLAEYGLFLAKSITVIVGLLVLIAGIFALSQRKHKDSDGHIEVKDLGARFENFEEDIKHSILYDDELKALHKAQRKQDKLEEKQRKKNKGGETAKKRIFVLDFDGDMKASAVENLREEISAILTLAQAGEEVLVRL